MTVRPDLTAGEEWRFAGFVELNGLQGARTARTVLPREADI